MHLMESVVTVESYCMDTKEQAKQLMDVVHICALQVLEYPRDEREALYESLTQQNYADARKSGLSEKTAAETAHKMEGFIRNMVSIIEQGGGKQGNA